MSRADGGVHLVDIFPDHNVGAGRWVTPGESFWFFRGIKTSSYDLTCQSDVERSNQRSHAQTISCLVIARGLFEVEISAVGCAFNCVAKMGCKCNVHVVA